MAACLLLSWQPVSRQTTWHHLAPVHLLLLLLLLLVPLFPGRLLMSKPVNVARALRVEPLRVMRLVYLHSMRRAAGISLRAAVSMTGRQFVLLYPGYKAWLAHNYSAGGVPRLYRGDKEGGEEEEEEEEDEEEGEDEREEQ